MRKVIIGAVGLALILSSGAAYAVGRTPWHTGGRMWDDLSWWGNSGATPAPYKDATRSGYWWWPTEPASNAGDTELWGNRGKIFHTWTPPQEEPPKVEPPKELGPEAERTVPVLNHILFDFDKAVLKPEGKATADEVVQWMKQYPKDTVAIEGHTDSMGSDAYNMALGQRRADAVKQYLVENGVDPGRITAESYGESKPVVDNTTPANRKLNRRAVFNIHIVN